MDRINNYLDAVAGLLAEVSRDDIRKVVDLVRDAYNSEKQVFIMGNGGSAATATHLACDLQKGLGCAGDKRFKVMALTDNVSIMTAWANDADYSEIFTHQLETWVQPGDLVIGISGSGNSPNVVKGIELAREMGAVTVGMTGFQGGKLAQQAEHSIVVYSNNLQHIEDVHVVLSHLIFRYLLEEITPCP